MLNEEYDSAGYDFCKSCRSTLIIENNEKPPCDIDGKCPYVSMVLPELDGKTFELMECNRIVADIFLRSLRLSDRVQYTFSTKKGEYSKFIPTLSQLKTVIENYFEVFSQDEKSDIIDKISKIYPVMFNMRARV